MPAIRKNEATEKLAKEVETTSPDNLVEIYSELFPERKGLAFPGADSATVAAQLARHIREGLEPEEVIGLWRVVFPADRHVNYDEEEDVVLYNEEAPWYSER